MNSLSLTKVPAPFSFAFKGQAPATDVNTALYQIPAAGRPDGELRVLRRPHRCQEVLPLRRRQLSGRGQLPGDAERSAVAARAELARRVRRFHGCQRTHQPARLVLRPRQFQAHDQAGEGCQGWSGVFRRPVFLRGSRGRLLRGRVPARGARAGGDDRILRSRSRRKRKVRSARRRGGGRRRLPTRSPFLRAPRTTSSWAKSTPSWSN